MKYDTLSKTKSAELGKFVEEAWSNNESVRWNRRKDPVVCFSFFQVIALGKISEPLK